MKYNVRKLQFFLLRTFKEELKLKRHFNLIILPSVTSGFSTFQFCGNDRIFYVFYKEN